MIKLHDKNKKSFFVKLQTPILLFVLFATAIFSCTKAGSGTAKPDDPHVINFKDTVFPVVTIAKPTPNQVFKNGDVIEIAGKVTDTSIYRGKLKIVNDANGTIVKEQEYELHGLPLYDFSLTHQTSVSTTGNYTVTAEWEDHGFNVTTKSVKVKVDL